MFKTAKEYANQISDIYHPSRVPLSTLFDAARQHRHTPSAFWVDVAAILRGQDCLAQND